MERDVLFIGHARPQDNDFTLWLQAKLINEGYKAICDLSLLIGGEEDFWKVLQETLEVYSVKYLLVLSEITFQKQGVLDEWEHANAIARKHGLKDFIYVLKIDEVAPDVRIGLNRKNHFQFDKSWALGLKNLFKKLDQDRVPKSNETPLSVDAWSKNKFSTFQGIIEQRETYYSNWVEISKLPEKIYFFQFHNELQAGVVEKYTDFPVVRHDNYIISFSESLPTKFEKYDFEIAPRKAFHVEIEKAFQKFDGNDFPTYEDLRRFLVRLLKTAWNAFLTARGLHQYEMSQKTKCFYYVKDQLDKDKVFFQYNGRTTYKQLIGDYFNATWHYCLSATTLLKPILCYSLRAHIVFSDDGFNIWSNKNKVHRARRSKGKSFFNKEWRGLMLGFLASISDDEKEIRIPISETKTLNVPVTTITFECDYGYEEPKTDGRIVPLDYYEDLEDAEDDFEGEDLNTNQDGD